MKKVNEWTRRALRLSTLMLLIGFLGACTDNTTPPPPSQTVTDIVLADANFSILRDAIGFAGLSNELRRGNLTVLAPDNAAFQASGFADAAAVRALGVGTVKSVLEYHVLGFRIPSSEIVLGNNTAVPSFQGSEVYISKPTASSGVSVNNARVTRADIRADNGLIHVIDRVLMPATRNLLEIARENSDLTYLVAAATRAASSNPAVVDALTSTTNAFTVFAPTNAAFIEAGFPTMASIEAAPAETLAAVILNHVISNRAFSPTLANGDVTSAGGGKLAVDVSSGVTIKGNGNTQAARVTVADVMATNGVVHLIDRVLLP